MRLMEEAQRVAEQERLAEEDRRRAEQERLAAEEDLRRRQREEEVPPPPSPPLRSIASNHAPGDYYLGSFQETITPLSTKL